MSIYKNTNLKAAQAHKLALVAPAYAAPTPEFPITDADGYPSSDWGYAVIAPTPEGDHTHQHVFGLGPGKREQYKRAKAFAAKVTRRGWIDPRRWAQGGPWDAYKTPQTPEEEIAEWKLNGIY